MISKSILRKKYKALRHELSEEAVHDLSLKIANMSLRLPIWDKTNYHIFLPISEKKEINTEYLLHILHGKDKTVIVPKADFESGEMIHYILQENTHLSLSKHGIPEPVSGITVTPKDIEVVFVPLLCFDKTGTRIGYGKGFYDRFLAKCSPNTQIIGLSFFAAEDKIEADTTDIPLDFCVTPTTIYRF